MSSFIFANDKTKTPKIKYHTPTTFRTQRKLLFSSTPILQMPQPMHPPPPGVSPPRTSPAISSAPTVSGNSSYYPPINNFAINQPQFIMPWAVPGTKDNSSLYKTSSPDITYPAGSRDEEKNNRFVEAMDMYLFTNFQVRAILVGDRPHPFVGYTRLAEYYK